MISMGGVSLGAVAANLGLALGQGWIDQSTGLYLRVSLPTPQEMTVFVTIVLAGMVVTLVPAIRAYRL